MFGSHTLKPVWSHHSYTGQFGHGVLPALASLLVSERGPAVAVHACVCWNTKTAYKQTSIMK